jgi:hypothetical protein
MKRSLVVLLFSAGLNLYAEQVEVTPSNMGNWSFATLDASGNPCTPSDPDCGGSGSMVTGPATPPLGTGSANLQTGVGNGDAGTGLGSSDFNGMALSALTALSYWTYDTVNNGQQFPYLALNFSYDGGTLMDTLFFEPPYQQPSTGDPSLPDQGATALNTWQEWNALEGGWWDNNGTGGNTGGAGEVAPLSYFESQYPDAIITPDPDFPTLDALELQVGFGSSGETENGNVDALTVNGTTYDFEPDAPEPGTFFLLGGGLFAGLLIYKRRSTPVPAGCGN